MAHSDIADVLDEPAGIGDNRPPLDQRLKLDHEALVQSIEQVAAQANTVPKEITDDAENNRVGEIVKDVVKVLKAAEAARSNEKEPFLHAGRVVDGFFKPLIERAQRIQAALSSRGGAYMRAKEDAERRRLQEIARQQREEAAAMARAAEQAAAAGRTEDATEDMRGAIQAEDAADEAALAAAAKPADLVRARGETGVVSTLKRTWDFEITDYDGLPLDKLRAFIARADLEKAVRAYVRINKGDTALAGVRVFERKDAQYR